MNAIVEGAKIAADSACMKIGVWVDDPLTGIDEAYAKRLRSIGVTTAAVMVNKFNGTKQAEPWKLLAPESTIVGATRALRAEGIDIVLTCWPRPAKMQLVELATSMSALMRQTKAAAIEVDAEANWHPRHLAGFASMKDASAALVETLRVVANGARCELTTFPGHAEARPGALVSPHLDVLIPQAYSVRKRSEGTIAWDGELGPGRMQRMSYERAIGTGCPHVVMGLAAYDQGWPGRTIPEAMQLAIGASSALGCTEVRYWSSKHVVGKFGQASARKTIARAAGIG